MNKIIFQVSNAANIGIVQIIVFTNCCTGKNQATEFSVPANVIAAVNSDVGNAHPIGNHPNIKFVRKRNNEIRKPIII